MIPPMARWVRAAGLDVLEGQLQARHEIWLWAVLATAFVARAAIAAMFTDLDPTTANIWEYGDIARATLEHGRMVCSVLICHSASELPADTTFVYPTAF